MKKGNPGASRGFTLLELIIVIAILAILSVAVVLVINPAETLARARDSQRLSDLSAIKSAIGLYLSETTSPDLMASAGTCGTDVHSSSPNPLTRAAGACDVVDNTNVLGEGLGGEVDGTGWLPVDLTDGGAIANPALSNFPVDPVNDETNGTSTAALLTEEALIYMYSCDTNNNFELGATMESVRYRNLGDSDKESTDGGDQPNVYEIGTDGGLDLCTDWTD